MRTKTPEQATKILHAAGILFGRQRFHEVRMEDIAAEAEVGKGTLYRYFADKEELYLALLEQAADQLLSRLRADVAASEGPRGKLLAVTAGIIEFFDEHPHLFDLIQRAEVMAGASFPWKRTRDEVSLLVEQLLNEGRVQDDFEVGDVEVTTWVLLGGIRAVIRFGKRPRPRDIGRRILTAVLPENPAGKSSRRLAARAAPVPS